MARNLHAGKQGMSGAGDAREDREPPGHDVLGAASRSNGDSGMKTYNAALRGGEAVPLESIVRGENPGKDEQ